MSINHAAGEMQFADSNTAWRVYRPNVLNSVRRGDRRVANQAAGESRIDDLGAAV